MLPNDIFSALKKLYKIINGKQIHWILTGSTSLAIQDVDVKINDDIDILTDKQGSDKIDKLLENFRLKKPNYSISDKYKSYFGIYKIGNVKIEVMGEFQYLMNDGSWSKPNQNNKIIIKKFERMSLPILSLDRELLEYENVGAHDKVEKIREALKKIR